jgi:hypothetical protein
VTLPTHQGVTTAGDSNGSGITGVSRPTTTTDDLMYLDLYYESGVDYVTGAMAFSNGTWTIVETQVQTDTTPDFTHVRWRSKYAGEGATFNITWNATIGSCWRTACVNAYRLVDTTTPIDATPTKQAGADPGTPAVAPGLTVATADALVIMSEADYDGRNASPPTGTTPTWTERTDFGNLAVADGPFTAAGATGDRSMALTAGGSDWCAGLTALRPATPGGAAAQNPYTRAPLLHPVLAR